MVLLEFVCYEMATKNVWGVRLLTERISERLQFLPLGYFSLTESSDCYEKKDDGQSSDLYYLV